MADLDAILGGPVFFKLHGKSFEIKSVTTEAYLRFIKGLNEFNALTGKEDLTVEEATDKTLAVFQPLIPELTADDLMKCTQPQVAALFNLVVERVQGKIEGKKKVVH